MVMLTSATELAIKEVRGSSKMMSALDQEDTMLMLTLAPELVSKRGRGCSKMMSALNQADVYGAYVDIGNRIGEQTS